MICPGCRVQIPDTAVICDHCNTVIDTNTSNDTNPRVSVPAMQAEAAAAAVATGDEKRPQGLLDGPIASSAAIEDLLNEIRAFAPSEKLTLAGAALLMLGVALPWRESRTEPVEIGLVAGNWPLLVAVAGIVVVLVHFLRRKDWALPYRNLFLGGAVASSFLALLGAAAFIRLNDVTKTVVGVSAPLVEVAPREGAYLAAFAALLCLAGALLSLIRRQSLPG